MTQVNTSMNFLPEDYVEKRQAARAAVVFIGLLFAVVGGIVGAFLFQQHNMEGIVQKHDQVAAAKEDASKKIKEYNELKKQKQTMFTKAEITTTLMERVSRHSLLYTLTNLRPARVEFVSIDLSSKEVVNANGTVANAALEHAQRVAQGLPDEAAKPPELDVTIDLVGTAPSNKQVADYLSALKKSPILSDETLLFSEEVKKNKDDAPVCKFSIEMHVDPKADMRNSDSLTDALLK